MSILLLLIKSGTLPDMRLMILFLNALPCYIDYLFEKIKLLLVVSVKLSTLVPILVLLLTAALLSGAQGLKTYSGGIVSIDSPVDDDIFAAGSMVNINAPVNSAVVAGGTINVNAPVKGDVIAGGGQINLNSDVGGKVVAGGGTLNLGGMVGTNLVAAGGQINVLSGTNVSKDAYLAGGSVSNSGRINGTLSVSAQSFQNSGSAAKVDFYQMETRHEEKRSEVFDPFRLLMILGYLILGLLLVRYLPKGFLSVDDEIRSSPVIKTIVGFLMLIAAFVAIFLVAITVVGLPIAFVAMLLILLAWMLSGIFVAFSLGRWIGGRVNVSQSDLVLFLIGFIILNVVFLLPYVGGLVGIISLSLGFGAFLYAARHHMHGSSTAS
jgi:hypothetical protein